MNIEKLINDLKENVQTNLESGDKCDICRQNENLFQIADDYCVGCGIADCETLSEKYRTYRMSAAWYTDSWVEHAFSDTGADLSPTDYGFIEYYGDEITEEAETALNVAMEEFFCGNFN